MSVSAMKSIPNGTSISKREDTTRDTILILDFGGQYTHMISRRVRELHVYSEVVPCDTPLEKIKELGKTLNIKGIILSGGPDSVYDTNAPKFDEKILDVYPVLGLCYGHQLIAKLSGGHVERAPKKEYGPAKITIFNRDGIFDGLSDTESVWNSHGDMVFNLPTDFEVLARSDNAPVAAFRHRTKPIWGIQFHPEVSNTPKGKEILGNYVGLMCGASANWKIENVEHQMIQSIKETVGDGTCLVALSGGVDSTVAAVLMAKALGANHVKAVYIDTGLMREGETNSVVEAIKKVGIDLKVVYAGHDFLLKLERVSDPEKKRKIIGEEFGLNWKMLAPSLKADFLVQGTIYPDRVESGSTGKSAKIKTHHNVGGLPDYIRREFKGVVEPLRDLYKDEVRVLAKQLGLPDSTAFRQPFPGPGLAVRIIGEITSEKLEIERKADHIVTEELEAAGLAKELSQYFAVLTNTMSTGVKGDSRAYGYTVAIRAIRTEDFMTGSFARIPLDLLEKISTRITNEIQKVNRVVYDVTNKPPATVEWE